MTKKHLSALAVILVIVVALSVLTACNSYKWNAIGGGSPNAETFSNGGYFVRQGEYVYFINGAGNETGDNTFGTPVKQSLMRATIKNGVIDNSTSTIVVPQIIYNKNSNGGFAIFGEWIYYVTPNVEPDKNGNANTTWSNIMRTKIDASVTQLIATLATREINIFYTPSRVLYYENNTIKFVDFSGMKTTKNINDGKGAYKGDLADNVTSVTWNYDDNYKLGQATNSSDYIFYTQTVTGDESYKFYNNTYAVKPDGSDRRLLISEKTYIPQEKLDDYAKHPENYINSTFKVSIMKSIREDDQNVTLYYSKEIKSGENSEKIGFFVNKFNLTTGLKVENEKKLAETVPTSLYPISYGEGCLVLKDDGYYLYKNDVDNKTAKKIVEKDNTILKVIGNVVYYAPTAGTAVLAINIDVTRASATYPTATYIIQENFLSDWLIADWDIVKNENSEIVNVNFFFFTKDDTSYLHYIDVMTFTNEAEPYIDKNGNDKYDEGEQYIDVNGNGKRDDAEKSALLGRRTAADQAAWDEANK